MALVAIKHDHVYSRVNEDDVLLAWATRSGDTDALVQWTGSEYEVIYELPGTDLIYDSVTWLSKVFFCDGINGIWVYDFEEGTICLIETAPPVQYLTVFQERLIGGGDSRTRARVESDGGVWPADSNRDRVRYCEAIDYETWSPNNFIDSRTGTGEVISGLGVNSVTSSERGAQSQLVVFKSSATLINDGVLGSGDQRLNIVSEVIGCPAYHTIVNTPYGLMFMSRDTVCVMRQDPKEPEQIGFAISPEIKAIPEDTQNVYDSMKAQAAAIFHDYTYKLSIAAAEGSVNSKEWWLDLRPAVFPEESNWYGPHSGDAIMQYRVFNGFLVGAEHGTMLMWKLDQEGFYGSMEEPMDPRESVAISARLQVPGMKLSMIDAYGFTAEMDEATDIVMEVDVDRGAAQEENTWTSPAALPDGGGVYSVVRPIKRPGHDAQITLTHAADSDIEIHSLYIRERTRRKQSEKQATSSQT